MRRKLLKLKQASAVLQAEPKELQNLVQFGVLKPKRSIGTYWFDANALLAAKIALCLKESLGTRTSVLARILEAYGASAARLRAKSARYVNFSLRVGKDAEPIHLRVPLLAFERELQARMSRANLYPDLPRGRKRRGWKDAFLKSLKQAARDVGEISEEEVLRTVRSYRKERRAPKITIVAQGSSSRRR